MREGFSTREERIGRGSGWYSKFDETLVVLVEEGKGGGVEREEAAWAPVFVSNWSIARFWDGFKQTFMRGGGHPVRSAFREYVDSKTRGNSTTLILAHAKIIKHQSR